MPATQISFASFAASLLASVQDEPIDCTPSASPESVLTQDGGLVAQAAASGGECTRIDLRRVYVERPSLFSIREEFWLDHMHPGWSGVGLDAPSFIPSGSAFVLGLDCGCPFVDGYVSRPWGYV